MGKVVKIEVSKQLQAQKKGRSNSDLRKELLKRGFYVQPVTRGDAEDIEYLIVSTLPPRPASSN
jgi:hypothetical protein